MRRALLLLPLLLLPCPVAAQGRRSASPAALAEARRFLCPNGGVPQGRGRCAPGARGGGLAGDGVDPEVRGWDRGIAPATRAQRPCPDGTRPDTARLNPGVTRCIPA